MNENTRFAVALLAVALVFVLWVGSTVGTLVWACQPGNAGGVLAALFVACVGWGFMQEARKALGECC